MHNVGEEVTVKPITVELPKRITEEINLLLENGWFANEAEIVRMAL